jgi:iron complex transport system substrate-binding protein
VILAPAAADIFLKLGVADKVAGVTKNVDGFEGAEKVGSHLRPNMEIIKSLNPDLIVIGSAERYYKDSINVLTGLPVLEYDPTTLEGILEKINEIGTLTDKEAEAEKLNASLREKLASVKPVKERPGVLFEISQMPYMVTGKNNIVTDIINTAGGQSVVFMDSKIVKLSLEMAVMLRPDVYIWQKGPMNKNPIPPQDRPEFAKLASRWIEVDEKEFSRANTNSFDAVLKLNSLLAGTDN